MLQIGEKFHVKIQDSAFLLKVKTLEEALGYLVAYYYVLHHNFPKSVKFVFSFFDRLFGMSSEIQSRLVTNFLKECLM